MQDLFTRNEKIELLKLARSSLETFVDIGSHAYTQSQSPHFLQNRGVFVTLREEGELRGCVGYPLPGKPLHEGIVDNVIAAASEDPRFLAVSKKELPVIDIEISILSVPEVIKSIEEIQVGRDGLIVTRGPLSGLLLPQVPVEQNWNLEEYLSHACLKAGLQYDEWRRGVRMEIFQAVVFSEKDLLMLPDADGL